MTLPDENGPRFPQEWEELVLPRRGDQPKQPFAATWEAVKGAGVLLQGFCVDATQRDLLELMQGPKEVSLSWAIDIAHLLMRRGPIPAVISWVDFLVGHFGLPLTIRALGGFCSVATPFSSFARAGELEPRDALLIRLRAHLAAATDERYQEAVEAVDLFRDKCKREEKVAIAFLFPDEEAWLNPGSSEFASLLPWMLATTSDPAEAARWLRRDGGFSPLQSGPAPYVLPTFLNLMGERGGRFLTCLRVPTDPDQLRNYARALACYPQLECLEFLLDHEQHPEVLAGALDRACENFPEEMAKLLSARRGRSLTFRRLLRSEPQLQGGELPTLQPPAPSSSVDEWPDCLQGDHWGQDLPHLELEPIPFPSTFAWPEGKTESWPVLPGEVDHESLTQLPPEALARITAGKVFSRELDALVNVQALARLYPREALRCFAPFCDRELLVIAAELCSGKRSQQALGYLRRYPREAALSLIPIAFNPEMGGLRVKALAALRDLAQLEGGRWLKAAAIEYGPEAQAALEQLLRVPPRYVRGAAAKLPKLPPGFSVSRYLPPKLNNGKALGPAAVTRLSALLCQADRSEYLEDVAEACQRESLQDFCFELFEDWLEQGGAAPEFMLRAVTWLFDDRTLKRLEPLLDEWLEEHRRGLLFKGLRALSKVATSRVVYWLVRALRRWEGELVVDDLLRDIVEGTGIEKEALIDASIPHLDLSHESGLTLDLGTRFLKLDLDESWRPVLRDMDGHVLENWPSPQPADDPDLSERAKEQYLKVKAELNELVPLQGRRLELALSQQRRWGPQGFRSYIWDHPLTYRLARRLVWGVYGERGLEQSFCIESPNQLATLAGETFLLPVAGQIGICHPLDWSQDERLDWYRRGFDEQPVKQTLRQVFEPEGSETWETRVTDFPGGVVDGQALARLARDGWDLHYSNKLARRWADGTLSVLEFPVTTPQKLVSLSFLHGKSHQAMDLAHVPPVVYSESILSLNRHLSKDG